MSTRAFLSVHVLGWALRGSIRSLKLLSRSRSSSGHFVPGGSRETEADLPPALLALSFFARLDNLSLFVSPSRFSLRDDRPKESKKELFLNIWQPYLELVQQMVPQDCKDVKLWFMHCVSLQYLCAVSLSEAHIFCFSFSLSFGGGN